MYNQYQNKKLRIARFYKGYGGYPKKYEYCELQVFNEVYKDWTCVSYGHLGIEFVKDECMFRKINYKNIPHVYIEKGDTNEKPL